MISCVYPRINVATLLLIRKHHDLARAEAAITLQKLELSPQRDHWWLATKVEAMLLMGHDIEGALRFYQRAVTDRSCRPQDRKSMHDQLIFLRPHWPAEIQTQLSQNNDATRAFRMNLGTSLVSRPRHHQQLECGNGECVI